MRIGDSIKCCRVPRHVQSSTLPLLIHPLPVPYQSGLPWPHKGTGTDTIFDFIPPPPPQLNFYRPPEFLYLSLTHSMPVSYLSGLPRPHKGMGTDTIVELPVSSRPVWYLTCPLLVPYPSLTCPLPIPYCLASLGLSRPL